MLNKTATFLLLCLISSSLLATGPDSFYGWCRKGLSNESVEVKNLIQYFYNKYLGKKRGLINKATYGIGDFTGINCWKLSNKVNKKKFIEITINSDKLDLRPLGTLKKLKSLKIRNASQSTINTMSNLHNLNKLNLLINKKVRNLDSIRNLTNLESLKISRDNHDSPKLSLSFLQNITSLKELVINGPIVFEDTSILGDIKSLEKLSIIENAVIKLYSDKNKEENTGGKYWKVTRNGHTMKLFHDVHLDISFLPKLTLLKELNISGSLSVKDFSPIQEMTNLSILNLSTLDLRDVHLVTNLKNLKILYFGTNILSREEKQILKDNLPDTEVNVADSPYFPRNSYNRTNLMEKIDEAIYYYNSEYVKYFNFVIYNFNEWKN